jgi:hypothetical protein
MCESAKEIKFCSCLNDQHAIIHNKNSRRQKELAESSHVYRWTLSRYAGPADFKMDGILMEPADRLNQDITAADLQLELNDRNCFDFNYDPDEGDNLEVWTASQGNHTPISFIFENGTWKIAQYNTFIDRTEKINQGKIRFE